MAAPLSQPDGYGNQAVPGNLAVAGSLVVGGTIASASWSGGTVTVPFGGTGITSYAVGDLLYADTTTSLAKRAAVAVGSVLVSGGVGVAPAWSANPTLVGVGTLLTISPTDFGTNVALRILQGSMTGGSNVGIVLGRAESGNNRALIGFNYVSSGSTSNNVGIGFFGGADLITVAASGVVSAVGGVASTSTTTGTIIVTGGVGVSGAIYAGGSVGIGLTGAAATALHVEGNSSAANVNVVTVSNRGSGAGTAASLVFRLGGSSYGAIRSTAAPNVLGFGTTNADVTDMTLSGTTTSTVLAIAGTAEATVGGLGSFVTPGGIYSAKKIITASQVVAGASTTSLSSLNIPHGAAPSAPVDGDIWTTTAGLYVRINGATVGPLS